MIRKFFLQLFIFSVLNFIFSSIAVAQTVRYVKEGGAGNESGNSWGNASASLQMMINASVAGDQVWVARGVYKPVHRADNMSDANSNDRDNAFVLRKDIKIYGGFAGNETALVHRDLTLLENASILSGEIGNLTDRWDNAYHVVISAGDVGTGELNGFTITGGNSDGTSQITVNSAPIVQHIGGGIRMENSSPKLSHLIITKNRASYGGGMANSANSSPEISNVLFSENSVSSWGGGLINLESSPSLEYVRFTLDSASLGAGMYNQNSTVVMDSVVFLKNTAGAFGGAIMNSGSTVTLDRVLFLQNYANSRGGAVYNHDSETNISNSVFDSNECQATGGAFLNYEASAKMINVVFYNNRCIYNPQGGGICNADSDLTLINITFTKNRQAIFNEGSYSSDFSNVLIWDNTDADIEGSVTIRNSYTQTAKPGSNNIQGNADPFINIDNPRGNDGIWGTRDDGLKLKLLSAPVNAGTNLPINQNSITEDITGNSRILSGTVDIGAYEEKIYSPDPNGILYVNQAVTNPNGNGSSWSEALPSLEDALNFARTYSPISAIWVAEGAYQPSARASFVMTDGLKIFGGFAGTEASLAERNLGAGHNSILVANGRVVIDNSENSLGNDALLDGFVITGGQRGMLNVGSSPSLNNLVFTGNSATDAGGGMANSNSSPIVSNVVFYNNSSGFHGGAMSFDNQSSPLLTNLTFVGNKAPSGAGGGLFIDYLSGAQAANLVFWGNSAQIGSGFYYDGNGANTISYSYLQLPRSETGIILGTSDPFIAIENPAGADGKWFTGDDGLMLKIGSPAIDAGNNDAFYGTGQTTDITGNTRIQHSRIDMGAYERPLHVIPDANDRVYVKKNATGYGSSWSSASAELADALISVADLNAANPGTVKEIWVAAGTYFPMFSASGSSGDSRDRSFVLVKDVKIYGGFAGTETSLAERKLEILENVSVLDGNFNASENSNDDAYHVVIAAGDLGTAALNGFRIQSGNANGDSFSEVNGQQLFRFSGGGICIAGASPQFSNLVVANNHGSYGAGIYNLNSTAVFTNVQITNNNAVMQGGGIYNRSAAPILTNLTISGNTAPQGGGIFNTVANPFIRNSIVYGNTSGMQNENGSLPLVNYSLIQGMAANPAANIFDGNTNPMFVDAANGNFRLQSSSALINGGNSLYFTAGQNPDLSAILTDIAGNPRVAGPAVDLGAYETLSALPITLTNFSANTEGSAVKLQWTTSSETNNNLFIISRSIDGRIFKETATVAGAGNTALPKDYIYYDKDLAPGNYYYRLQQQDLDGRTVNHGIVKVSIKGAENLIKVYPNPAQKILTVEFPAAGFSSLELLSSQGRLLQYFHLGDRETRKLLHLNALTPGIYYIRLAGSGQVELRKLIKQ